MKMINYLKQLFFKKTKFTKHQRNLIYVECLKIINYKYNNNFTSNYLCYIITDVVWELLEVEVYMKEIRENFPELYKQRTSNKVCWFINDDERIVALKKCIELTSYFNEDGLKKIIKIEKTDDEITYHY